MIVGLYYFIRGAATSLFMQSEYIFILCSSIIKMKRNKPNNSGQRQRKTPQPPTSPPPPTVSPLYQRDDNEEEEPTLWPNQRRRSAGPLAAPQFQIPTVVSMPAWNPNQLPQLPESKILLWCSPNKKLTFLTRII